MALLLTGVALTPNAAEGFRNVEVGGTMHDATLPNLAGGRSATVLAPDAEANVVMFFRPDTTNGRRVLAQLPKCLADIPASSVQVTGIVSNAYPRSDVRAAARETGFDYRILVDKGDLYYGRVGVFVLPSIAVVDHSRRLRANLPFLKVDYCNRIKAHVEFARGRIDEAELQRRLNPPPAVDDGAVAKAMTNIKLATALTRRGRYAKALPWIQRAVKAAPQLPKSQGLLSLILAKLSRCDEAQRAAEKALRLEAKQPDAHEAQNICGAASSSSRPPPPSRSAQKPSSQPPRRAEPLPAPD